MSAFLEQEIIKRGLPDLWTSDNGDLVVGLADWEQRKSEIVSMLERNCYGKMPRFDLEMHSEILTQYDMAVCGKAVQKTVKLSLTLRYENMRYPCFSYGNKQDEGGEGDKIESEKLVFNIDVVMPKAQDSPPVFIYASFHPTLAADSMPVEEIIDQGYAIASFCYQDIVPDSADEFLTARKTYPDVYDKSDWAAISKWAWAFGRVMDYLVTHENIGKTAVCGASRLGKAALWAGICDERFSLIVPMISGTGGAALYRGNKKESADHLIETFPHWFCGNYADYLGREDELPWDSHFVLALAAPRNLYIFAGDEDEYVDCEAEFLAAKAASKAYELYGMQGLIADDDLPYAGVQLHGGSIGYHLRYGPHCVSRHDWNALIAYRNRHDV